MNKFLITSLCFAFLFSFNMVIAQQNQQGIHDAGTGITDPDLKEANQGTGQGQTTSVDLTQEGQTNQQGQDLQSGASRRSRVSNAVQSMLEVAERNQGIGQQVRNIAQNQIQIQEEAENALETAQQRKGFMKFLIGPDHSQLKEVEDRLDRHNQNLEQLKVLREDVETEEDVALFDEQIQAMEEVTQELESELKETDSGFSLFGWMNRMFNR